MTIDIDTITLAAGAHSRPEDGMCVLEAVSYIAGEPFSDHPECASPVVAAFLRSWNDALDDTTRQQLKQYIPRLVGSRGTQEQEGQRSWMALDWLVRVQTPAWLRVAGLTEQADTLAGLGEVTPESCPSIRGPLQAVRSDAAAAWDAAGARAAAGAAAGAAARDAAAAGAAARAAAGARAAAWDAAAAGAAAAARAAARDAAWDAAAAGAAARAALRPTVEELQPLAHQLVDRLLTVTETS